ncbi:Mechanosensitive ion channel protein 8 [Bienertia sinuspersici]
MEVSHIHGSRGSPLNDIHSSNSNKKKNKQKLAEEERLGLLQNQNDPMSQSFNSEIAVKIEPSSSSSSAVSGEPSKSSANVPAIVVEEVPTILRETNQQTAAAAGVSGREDQVVRCSSNASFQQKKSGLMRMKTKSRLMDPPEDDKRSGRMNRSGFLGKSEEIEEDDPFGEDLPEEYKKGKLGIFAIIQWVSLVLIVAALICGLVIKELRGKTLWICNYGKWEVMILVLICGGLVSGWLIKLIVFFIERNFLLRKRVLYFVYGLRSSVQKFLWLGWVLLAWILILDKKVEKETKSSSFALCNQDSHLFYGGNIDVLVKTLLLKDALFNQYVIENLSGPPFLELQRHQEEEERAISEVQKLQNAGVYIPPDLRANCFPNEGKRSGECSSPRIGRSPVIGKSPRAPSSNSSEKRRKG